VVVDDDDNRNGYRSIAKAVDSYLTLVQLTKKPKTLAAYRRSLAYFTQSCPARCLDEITREDLLEFVTFLRDEKGQSPRSCWNKFAEVVSFLKSQKITGLAEKGDWPSFLTEKAEIYKREELDALFAVCTGEERIWFEFFLKTGMREQEVMYTYWGDIDFKNVTVYVTHKPDRNWMPKACPERSIPVPGSLINALITWRDRSDCSCGLVFPTKECSPRLDFLNHLKAAAKRAGLDSRQFWLHKFRSTFATWTLWESDLATVQKRLGYKDIESAQRYLRLRPNDAREHQKVNRIFA
jgi:integrase/recombinase XerD